MNVVMQKKAKLLRFRFFFDAFLTPQKIIQFFRLPY